MAKRQTAPVLRKYYRRAYDAHAEANEYSSCRPPSTAVLRTEPKSARRWRDLGIDLGTPAGGSGTPGPSTMWGRPRF